MLAIEYVGLRQNMKAILLRIGIDTLAGGTLGPIFNDGSFEYIPIPEGDSKSREERTYSNTLGRNGKSFSFFVPISIANRKTHFDPEFETFTYGDPTSKRSALLKLERGDLLVFYAGLKPYENTVYKKGLYIIGYFTVKKAIDFNELTKEEEKECYRLYANNAHLKRTYKTTNLVIVVGDKKESRLLDKAIPISQIKKARNGRGYHAVSNEMERFLGISGSIQRSATPRFIEGQKHIANLRRILMLKDKKCG